MSISAIETVAKHLALLCIKFSAPPTVPKSIIDFHQNPPWFSLSLATLYLSLAKGCLELFLPNHGVGVAVARRMEDEFFKFVDAMRFDVNVSDVIVFPDEQAAICQRWRMSPNELFNTVSDSYSVLELVFADRVNKYTEDFRRGVGRQLENQNQPCSLGVLVFVYKRFNQHMYGIQCNMATIVLDESLRHLLEFEFIFMDALEALTAAVKKSVTVLSTSV